VQRSSGEPNMIPICVYSTSTRIKEHAKMLRKLFFKAIRNVFRLKTFLNIEIVLLKYIILRGEIDQLGAEN
jgi:hypothetical protein